MPIPSPIAEPFTAAMDGFCKLCNLRGTYRTPSIKSLGLEFEDDCLSHAWFNISHGDSLSGRVVVPADSLSSFIVFTFAPEQNDGSDPVKTRALRSGEDSNRSSSSSNSSIISNPMAFLVLGSCIVKIKTP